MEKGSHPSFLPSFLPALPAFVYLVTEQRPTGSSSTSSLRRGDTDLHSLGNSDSRSFETNEGGYGTQDPEGNKKLDCNLLTSFQILTNVAKDGTLARLEYEFEQCTHDITSNVGKPLFANVCYVECRRQYRAAVQWLFVWVAAVPQCHACMHDCMARMSLLAARPR